MQKEYVHFSFVYDSISAIMIILFSCLFTDGGLLYAVPLLVITNTRS